MASSTTSIREEIYNEVKKIPEGRVTTYGEIANQIMYEQGLKSKKLNIKNQNDNSKLKISKRFAPRLVGYVLHQNKDSSVPCHRVVNRNGRLAPNFGGPSLGSLGRRAGPHKPWRRRAFDGWREQKRRLEAEGVKFADEMHVDLANCQVYNDQLPNSKHQ